MHRRTNDIFESVFMPLGTPCSHLVVVFTGRDFRLGMPITEFGKTLQHFNVNVLCVTDKTKTWYNTPKSFEGIKDTIVRTIDKTKPKQITLMGVSMGGFGSILFSSVIKCDRVIAISPQTVIDPKLTGDWDTRYLKNVGHLTKFQFPSILDKFQSSVKYTILCGRFKQDTIHVDKIPDDVPNISKVFVEEDTHNVPLYLKTRGELIPFFSQFMEEKHEV